MKNLKLIYAVLLSLAALAIASCQNNLDSAINEAIHDKIVTEEEWNSIVDIVDSSNNRKYKKEGVVDQEELLNYAKSYAEKKLSTAEVTWPVLNGQKPQGLSFKFFLERSGSMIAYDAGESKGQFKAAIVKMMNAVPRNDSEQHILYIVNDAVTQYPQTLKEFIKTTNIFNDTKEFGNPRYTNFATIFDSILNKVGENEVGILISDMIYSTKDMANLNPARICTEARNITETIFKGHSEKDVIIIKLNSDYIGPYYTFSQPNKGIPYKGVRPYYIMIVANHDVMQKLFTQKEYKEFCKFEMLPEYRNYYCFTQSVKQPEYSVWVSGDGQYGRFRAQHGKRGTRTVHGIYNIEKERRSKRAPNINPDEFRFVVVMDMSGIITESKYLLDTTNYIVNSPKSGFSVKEVKALTKEEKEKVKKFMPTATHKLILSTEEDILTEEITIALKNQFPCWIAESSSADDRDTNDSCFNKTTFAFEPLMKGIHNAFYSEEEEPLFFEIKISIKK